MATRFAAPKRGEHTGGNVANIAHAATAGRAGRDVTASQFQQHPPAAGFPVPRAEHEPRVHKPSVQAPPDRLSDHRFWANAFRLLLHAAAYWLLWSLRSLMPKRSTWRVAQFDTLRLRLVKLATRVVALKTRVMLHLPNACPDQAIMRLALERLPRLVC
jgi:hypothetical protein